jgi:predicted acylesterase/phospholipase RssA
MYILIKMSSSLDTQKVIKHLVISSGGPAGHMMYSILRTLNLKGIWDIKNIKTIYGSSIGSYIAIILSLRYDWQVLDDYLIKRPWEKIFVRGSGGSAGGSSNNINSSGSGDSESTSTFAGAKSKIENILRFYNNNGLYGLKEFTEMLRPVLQGKDMSINITMREFYEKTGVELHFIVTEINKFCVVDFNYKTHPNQSLIEASYMSCCYPFGFTPIYRDGCCYLDGGIINDYPVNECIRDQKCNLSEILGVKMLWERKPANLTDKSSVLQFVSTFFSQINSNFFENRVTRAIPNEVVCVSKVFSAQDWINWIKDENYRRELVLRGETFANVFLSYRRNFHETRLFEQSPHSPLPELDATAAVQNVILDTSASASELALDIIHTGDEYDIHEAETTDHDIIASTPNTTSFELHNNDETTMV